MKWGSPRRRTVLGAGASGLLVGAAQDRLRLGLVQSGTVQWIAAVIAGRHLDPDIVPVPLANTDAARVAMLAGSVDVAVSDWPFVAVQRAAGRNLVFAPLSSSTGAIMVPAGSPIRTLADLRGQRLGVAGGPTDKSWLVVRAAARRAYGLDLAQAATLSFGAPPLLGAKLQQGELNAVLTFWNFAARLEAAGCRAAITVAQCARILGLPGPPFLVGYVFNQDWARAHKAAITRFLGAASQAADILVHDPAAWAAVRPLMDAPDDTVFANLKQRFIAGIGHPDAATQTRDAAALLAVVLAAGGPKAAGGLVSLPKGVFWQGEDAG
jgi:NitT/TauT family transport system substrate-binding protein